MSANRLPSINIALAGGGSFCREILAKTTLNFDQPVVDARIVAVYDSDPRNEGMLLAKSLGLKTVTAYTDLYRPDLAIDLIIVLSQDPNIFNSILATKPAQIRLLSYQTMTLFWHAIGAQEEKLRERNREFQTILNGIQDFILVITPEMEIVEVNDAFLNHMGYCRDEVIGQKCHRVFQKINRRCGDEIICPLSEVVRNKRHSQRILTRVDQNNDLRYIEVTIYPIWENTGKISKFVEISRDITQRIKEEEEITRRLEKEIEERSRQLQETHKKLIHQDKMASLGKLSASVVHEINNPIAGILNLIILIQRILGEENPDTLDLEKFRRYLGLMETETRRISRIVSNLLGFSRQSKMELKHVSLPQLIEKTLQLNENLLKLNNIKVKQQLLPNLPEVIGSEDRLQQVFVNLISNAVEAMQPKGGGELGIEAVRPCDGRIAIRFSDNGVGIPDKNLSKLFEPFFTTKKKGKGVGLGLSVVYGIIKELGGTIHVDSKPDAGTTFSIELPVNQQKTRRT